MSSASTSHRLLAAAAAAGCVAATCVELSRFYTIEQVIKYIFSHTGINDGQDLVSSIALV